eukprot:EC722933.1.p1 GENE.EC722933.1~~EC722933.1.p1  ORF type:complete len:107 (+),score=5.59 EC722933.1:133-453(+)
MLDEASELAPRDLEAPMLFATWPGTILIPRARLDCVIAQCESSVQRSGHLPSMNVIDPDLQSLAAERLRTAAFPTILQHERAVEPAKFDLVNYMDGSGLNASEQAT